MLDPKPFFSPIGNHVVQVLTRFISGAAFCASSVVSDGLRT